MKNYSWKTTIAGFALIAAGIYIYVTTRDYTQPAVCIATGVGLLMAKDVNKTGLPQ